MHVSTAYCNCSRERVEEVVYAPPAQPEHVVTLVQTLPTELVDRITPDLVGKTTLVYKSFCHLRNRTKLTNSNLKVFYNEMYHILREDWILQVLTNCTLK